MQLDTGEIVLHARDAGSGPPLVLLHPGPGLDGSALFDFFAPRLADTHQVIALDLRGHGGSEHGDPARWTLAQAAEDARAAAEALELEGYTLLGHSFGGMVALQHAIHFPGHASRLVVSSSVADENCFDGLEASLAVLEPASLREQVTEAFEREGEVETPEEGLRCWIDQLPFFVAEPGGPGETALAEALRRAVVSPEAMAHEDWGDHDVAGGLAGIVVPTLVLAGAQDRMMPVEAVGSVARGIPGADLEIVENAGHFAFAEQPDAYFAALSGWLAAHPPPRRIN